MATMFYNYEYRLNHKERPLDDGEDQQEGLYGCTCVAPLFNVKDEMIGLSAKQNSNFYLYFSLLATDCSISLRDLLEQAEFYFDIVDFKREVIVSYKPELNDIMNEVRVDIDTSEEGPLKYGVYRMHLYAKLDNKVYTLFSPQDAILSVE